MVCEYAHYFAVVCVCHVDPLSPTDWILTRSPVEDLLETVVSNSRIIIADPYRPAIARHQPPPDWMIQASLP